MITEESSPQPTRLDDQPSPFPDPNAGLEATPVVTTLTRPTLQWWEPWIEVSKAMFVWVASVLVLLVLPLIVALPYMIYKIAAAGGQVDQESLIKDPTLIFISVLAILPVHVLTFVMAWFYVTRNGRYPFWKSIGFEWPHNLKPKFATMLSILLAIGLFGVATLVTTLWGGSKTDLDLLIESSLPARFVLAFAAVVTAPLVEEIIYRGVLYAPLERAAGKVIAIFAVSFLFSGVHVFQYWNNVAVIVVITLLSFTLTTVRAYTGRILLPFLIHLVFNGIQSVLIVIGAFVDHDAFK